MSIKLIYSHVKRKLISPKQDPGKHKSEYCRDLDFKPINLKLEVILGAFSGDVPSYRKYNATAKTFKS